MSVLKRWWLNELPVGVKLVLLALLANGLPAFVILMSIPTRTEHFFVWTIRPELNARLVGVMYSNALLLVAFAALGTSWARVRINMVVITLFSVLATGLTFFYLDPFLAHPWFHLTYWLSMYLLLLALAPVVFVTEERRSGGRLPIEVPLTPAARVTGGVSAIVSVAVGVALLFRIDQVNEVAPWTLPPLVGGLIGVLLVTHAAAYAWALWDGDWLRVRPMFWQSPPTGLLLILLPLLHASDLPDDRDLALAFYVGVIAALALANLGVVLSYRGATLPAAAHAR